MISQNVVYHRACLVAFYNRARARAKNIDKDKNQGQQRIEGIALAELIAYMKDTHIESDAAPVFRLARLYTTRQKLIGADVSDRFNNTHLKNRILAHQQDRQAYREGRNLLLAFSKDVGAALQQAYERDFDDEACILSKAAKIVRRDMFSTESKFQKSLENNCQQESTPQSLRSLVGMVLGGSTIQTQTNNSSRFKC